MKMPEALRSRLPVIREVITRGIGLYVLPAVLCLVLLAGPIGNAARSSDAAVYLVLLAALGAVILNWAAYRAAQKKNPSMLVFAWGAVCVLLVLIVEYEALPNTKEILSTLAVIGGCLALTAMFLLSFFLAAPHRNKLAHSTAVFLWVLIGFTFVFMIYRVWRDLEVGVATVDTWITLAVMIALIPAAFAMQIRRNRRRRKKILKADGLAEGTILQIVGETHMDFEDKYVTDYHAIIRYTVDGAEYQTKADIAKITTRWFGRKAFVGKTISVHYDPENPADAWTKKIDRHFFD